MQPRQRTYDVVSLGNLCVDIVLPVASLPPADHGQSACLWRFACAAANPACLVIVCARKTHTAQQSFRMVRSTLTLADAKFMAWNQHAQHCAESAVSLPTCQPGSGHGDLPQHSCTAVLKALRIGLYREQTGAVPRADSGAAAGELLGGRRVVQLHDRRLAPRPARRVRRPLRRRRLRRLPAEDPRGGSGVVLRASAAQHSRTRQRRVHAVPRAGCYVSPDDMISRPVCQSKRGQILHSMDGVLQCYGIDHLLPTLL